MKSIIKFDAIFEKNHWKSCSLTILNYERLNAFLTIQSNKVILKGALSYDES